MPHPTNTAQYQRHYIQLISRILNTRPNTSPFTLILDDLNQRAAPLINEIIRRSLFRSVNITFLSFETTRLPPPIVTIPCYTDLTREQILLDLKKALSTAKTNGKESLVVIDSLQDLLTTKNTDMSSLFNLIAGEFSATLIGTYHTDILPSQDTTNAYAPLPLDLLKYMATTIITCRSFAHVLSAKAARERSLPEPMHGLLNEAEGVVQDLHANDARGVVLDVEFRRKSGRPESETYFLRAARKEDYGPGQGGMRVGTLKQEFVTLLELEPMYSRKDGKEENVKGDDEIESTFNLGLTEKQKQAREGVVLPYFDAQKGEGGEGGRILYDMGEEDDFDEEEDEI